MRTFCLRRFLGLILAFISLVTLLAPPFTVTANAATVKVTSSGLKNLTTEYGNGVHLSGSFKSTGSKIYSIQASVSGTKLSKTISKINSYQYNLYNSKLDYAMTFGDLSAGTYTINYTVKTVSGLSQKFSSQITVKATSTITASGIKNLSTTEGTGTHLVGTLKSTGSKIDSIKVSVKNTSLSKTQNKINSYSYNLNNSTLDYAMTFGSLDAGTYTISYYVKTKDGNSKTFTSNITVKKEVTPTVVTKPAEKEEAVSSDTTYQNLNVVSFNGTQYYRIKNFDYKYCFDQTDYNRFVSGGKNKGCTATACSMVLCMAGETNKKGQLITPGLYPWYSDGSHWDYMTKQASNAASKTQLKKVTEQIIKGKAVAMWANNYHMVTVIGFRKGADIGQLKAKDLLIVDPYGGHVTTLDKAQHGGYSHGKWAFYTAY